MLSLDLGPDLTIIIEKSIFLRQFSCGKVLKKMNPVSIDRQTCGIRYNCADVYIFQELVRNGRPCSCDENTCRRRTSQMNEPRKSPCVCVPVSVPVVSPSKESALANMRWNHQKSKSGWNQTEVQTVKQIKAKIQLFYYYFYNFKTVNIYAMVK